MAQWSGRTLRKYSLLQLPELCIVVMALLLLQHWLTLSAWLFWGIIAAWIAKDMALFPLVWRAYEADLPAATEAIGQEGITRERLAPTGYIKVRGVLWRAEVAGGGPPIEPDKPVRVAERRGLTLIVVPVEETSGP
jgi:membrane-bound ClpP family serine protease